MDERVVGGAAAIVAYILWRRGVLQNAWAALWGQLQRAAAPTTNASLLSMVLAPGGNVGTSGGTPTGDIWQQSGCNPGNYSCYNAWQATNPDAKIVATEPQGLAATIAQYGSDLYNWCLAWVNKTRQAAGFPVGVYGAGTAQGACSQLSLRPGVAPAGATVCFAGAPGHIGIANGGDSYTSAGLVHGGLVTQAYVNNPDYIGWSL